MTGKVLEGRDRIGRALGRVLVRYARTSHHPTNARVEIDGDRAVLRTYVYAYHRMTTGDVWHLWARLYDGMERRDGRWLIVDHRLTGVDSEPHRPDIGNEWYGGHPGHLAPGPIPEQGDVARRALADAVPVAGAGLALVRERSGRRAARCRPASRRSSRRLPPLRAAMRLLLRDAVARAARGGGSRRAGLGGGRRARARPRGGGRRPPRRRAPRPLRPAAQPASRPAAAFDSDAALAYFRDYFGGDVPERVALLAERSPSVFEGYALLHRGVLRDGALEPKLAELLLCAVNAAEYQTAFVEIHARAARGAGATEAELVDAIVAVIPVAGASPRGRPPPARAREALSPAS